MNGTVLALLLSLLPITGGQFISLDQRINLLGEPPPNDLYSWRLTHPFESQTQKTNFAALCLAMDWDATRFFRKSTPTPADLRLYSQYYLTSGGPRALCFLKFHAQSWQTNWQAGPIEENVLKRLSLEASDAANDFFAKLAARADNVPYTRWFTWHNLMQERRKREAARSEEHTSELQSPRHTLFPYTTLFRSPTTSSPNWQPGRTMCPIPVGSLGTT